jgi:tetratricopeptide (TPR) repeat protein
MIRFLSLASAATLSVLLAAAGCAGYAGSVKEVRSSLLAGDKERALEMADKALEVDKPDELPQKLKGDNALLVVERATIKQGLEQYKASAVDFRASDKHLELLDLKNDTMGNIGKLLFSDDTTVYKAPAYEKLLLNTMNMLNYLAIFDLEEARVESRRLRVMQDYLADEESKQDSLSGLGSYLAGFTFEMSEKAEQALSHYDEALAKGNYPSLKGPIHRLAACTSFRTERLEAVLGSEGPLETCNAKPPGLGTILVVSGVGLAPYKEAERIPIGAALVIAGALLGALETAQAQRLAAKGLLTWINFPSMHKTPERFSRAMTQVDGNPIGTELGLDVTEQVIKAWESMKGKLIVAAITRMITRLIAGEATEQAVKQASGSGIGGLLAGLAVQGALTAADTPDTRSWVTLPSRIYISRVEVAPGPHQLSIVFEGKAGRHVETKTVNVAEGGFVVVPVASMR